MVGVDAWRFAEAEVLSVAKVDAGLGSVRVLVDAEGEEAKLIDVDDDKLEVAVISGEARRFPLLRSIVTTRSNRFYYSAAGRSSLVSARIQGLEKTQA